MMKVLFLSFFTLLLIAVMYIIGTRDYKITNKGVKIRKDLYYGVLSDVLAVILQIILLLEVLTELTAIFEGLFPEWNSNLAKVLAIMAVQIIAIIIRSLLFRAAKNGQKRVAFDTEHDEKE